MSKRRDGYIREIDDQARAQGWRIESLPGGHLRYTPPDPTKHPVVTGRTPTRNRSVENFLAELRRSGLVFRRRGDGRLHHQQQQPSITPATAQRREDDLRDDKRLNGTNSQQQEQQDTNTRNENSMTTNVTTKKDDAKPASNQSQPASTQPRTFAEALRAARERRGDTVEDLARTLETNPVNVLAWEAGTRALQRRHHDKLVTLYPELKSVDRPLRVRNVRRSSQSDRPASPPTKSAALAELLQLLRRARMVSGTIVPILEAARHARLGVADLIELVR